MERSLEQYIYIMETLPRHSLCVLAPTLFSMMFTAMLTSAFCNDEDNGISIRIKTGGKLFNLRRPQAKTKAKDAIVRDLLFADDCALNASIETKAQQCIDCFLTTCDDSTEVCKLVPRKLRSCINQPHTRRKCPQPSLLKRKNPRTTDKFMYLGSTLLCLAEVN